MNKNTSFLFRIDEDTKKQIQAKAALDGVSINDYILKAVKEYMNKDINFQSEQLGLMEYMLSEIKKMKEEFGVFYSIFIYYLVYFFAVNDKVIDNWKDITKPNDKEATKIIRNEIMNKAKNRRDVFIKAYKKEAKNTENLLEIMLADYMVQDE